MHLDIRIRKAPGFKVRRTYCYPRILYVQMVCFGPGGSRRRDRPQTDKILVGVSGGESGMRGFVAALSAATGEQIWKMFTVPVKGNRARKPGPNSIRSGAAPRPG